MQTGRTTNNITSHLETLNQDATRKEIHDRLETAKIVSDQMREVGREAGDIRSDVFKLKQKLNSLEPEWDTKFGMAEENGIFIKENQVNQKLITIILTTVSKSQSNILAANNTLNNMEVLSEKNNVKFQRWNTTMSSQLQELRDKIAKAKHAAEGVSIYFVRKN